MHPKEMWILTNFLKNGLQSHHNTANIIKFKDESGNLAKTGKDNARIADEHFTKVFKRDSDVDWTHVNKNPQKRRVDELGEDATFDEFNAALGKVV